MKNLPNGVGLIEVQPPTAMRLARLVTRNLSYFKGYTLLLRTYNRVLSPALYRIHDFDSDLTMDVNVCETVGCNIWQTPKAWEREERRSFCSALRPGAVVLDVGANQGAYTLTAAKRGCFVYAIEPDPQNVALLRRNIELNGFQDRVQIFEMAVADAPSTLEMHRNPKNYGGSSLFGKDGPTFTVKVDTIDSLDLPPIDVCKVDIEGAETIALSGMAATLKRSTNLKLLVEYSEWLGKAHADKLLAVLHSHFSSIQVVGGGEITPFCNLWCSRNGSDKLM